MAPWCRSSPKLRCVVRAKTRMDARPCCSLKNVIERFAPDAKTAALPTPVVLRQQHYHPANCTKLNNHNRRKQGRPHSIPRRMPQIPATLTTARTPASAPAATQAATTTITTIMLTNTYTLGAHVRLRRVSGGGRTKQGVTKVSTTCDPDTMRQRIANHAGCTYTRHSMPAVYSMHGALTTTPKLK